MWWSWSEESGGWGAYRLLCVEDSAACQRFDESDDLIGVAVLLV